MGSVDEIELVLANGRRVVWGSAEDSEAKAEVLAVLLKRPGNQIDVSVPGRPTRKSAEIVVSGGALRVLREYAGPLPLP